MTQTKLIDLEKIYTTAANSFKKPEDSHFIVEHFAEIIDVMKGEVFSPDTYSYYQPYKELKEAIFRLEDDNSLELAIRNFCFSAARLTEDGNKTFFINLTHVEKSMTERDLFALLFTILVMDTIHLMQILTSKIMDPNLTPRWSVVTSNRIIKNYSLLEDVIKQYRLELSQYDIKDCCDIVDALKVSRVFLEQRFDILKRFDPDMENDESVDDVRKKVLDFIEWIKLDEVDDNQIDVSCGLKIKDVADTLKLAVINLPKEQEDE